MKFTQMPYERVDFDKVKAEFAELEAGLDKATSGQEQMEVHRRYYELTGHVMTQMTLAEIRHDIDTTDEFYSAEQDFYDQNGPVFRNLCVSYQKKLYHSPYRAYLEERIGKVAFKNIELGMKSVDDKILPLMQEENAIQTEYNKLLATAKIAWRGETLNLSLMNPYLHSSDRGIRAEAWKKYTAFFEENQ